LNQRNSSFSAQLRDVFSVAFSAEFSNAFHISIDTTSICCSENVFHSTYAGQGDAPNLPLPKGVSRLQHGRRLKGDIEKAVEQTKNDHPAAAKAKGATLQFGSNVGLKLALKSLERLQSGINFSTHELSTE
jgi:hypothetical protein